MSVLQLQDRRPALLQDRARLPMLAFALALIALMITQSFLPQAAMHAPAPALHGLPLAFVPNHGQTNAAVRFQANDLGGMLFFAEDEIVLSLPAQDQHDPALVRLRFEDANPSPAIIGGDRLPGVVNYLTGAEPTVWQRNLPTYADIVYREIYPGIDLHYEGATGRLKGTYTVAPGADPARIRWRYAGATHASVTAAGDLRIALPNGAPLIEEEPIAWQVIDGKQISVDVRYVLSQGSISFAIGHYDPAQALIIDPTLDYSTYVGGSGFDDGEGIAVDSAGNIYVIGSTLSTNFPTQDALQDSKQGDADADDVVVFKLNPAGDSLIFSTYLGGGGNDRGLGIAVDDADDVYLTGATYSGDFPTTAGALQSECVSLVDNPIIADLCLGDAFAAKLSSSGDTLIYSTYLGGGAVDEAHAVAVDGNGNAHITGFTTSTNFLTEDENQEGGKDSDVFVVGLNAAGADTLYLTILGGDDGDLGTAIALDAQVNVYVTGLTASANFPTQNAAQASYGGGGDAFAARLDSSGGVEYSTYLGGAGEDKAYGIAVDASAVYLTGHTDSGDFPTTGDAAQASSGGGFDAFLAKLNANAGDLIYSSYLGGSADDGGNAVTVDDESNAYVTGVTRSGDFPLVDAFQTNYGGSDDAFVAKFNSDASSLVYSSYLGGNQSDAGDDIAVANAVAHVVGVTYSSNFPTVDALYGSYQGAGDIFVAKIADNGDDPQPSPDEPNLSQSAKLASQDEVTVGDVFSYTIELNNTGDADATVDVVDTLPAEVMYVSGSAEGATYDEETRTLTWEDVAVGANSSLSPFFQVTALEVDTPTQAVNSVTITVGEDEYVREATVIISPEDAPPPAPQLAGSFKTASQPIVVPGDTFSYTIVVNNSGGSADVTVVDALPAGVTYVEGSAPDATYDESARTLTWNETVPADGQISLTFQVTADPADAPAILVNRVEISAGEASVERSAPVFVVSLPDLFPILLGSYKTASQHLVAANETFSYTIVLHNSGTAEATVDVVDALPEGVTYVADTAEDAVYDEENRTLTWSDVMVPAGDRVSLSFEVTADPVDAPAVIVNRATISSADRSLQRETVVVVAPLPLPGDTASPQVQRLIIDEQDVLTDPEVTLYISATDDVAVVEMMIEEWQLVANPVPQWTRVQTSDWVPFAESYPWTLTGDSGTKFVSVWVADEAGNLSDLNSNSIDFASLLLSGEAIPAQGLVPYLVYYEAGVDVTATLEPTTGDADLYVWFPGNFFLPNEKSTNEESATDTVSFTTPRAGVYLFLVYGYSEATYDLSITPGGGPYAASLGVIAAAQRAATADQISTSKPGELMSEPVLSQAGLDPLGVVQTPTAPQETIQIFVPMIVK